MTDKELQKLRRPELLNLLLSLEQENETLRAELEEQKNQLAGRTILLEESGSIAEAALKVNHVFEAAQASADQYLDNIRRLNETAESRADLIVEAAQSRADLMLKDMTARCEALDTETKARCDALDRETAETCDRLRRETDEYCEKLRTETENKVRNKTEETERSCSSLEKETEEKCRVLENETAARCEAEKARTKEYVDRVTEECLAMKKKAEQDANAYWDDVTRKVRLLLGEHEELKEISV